MGAQYSLGTAEGVIRITYDPVGVTAAKKDQEALGASSLAAGSAMSKSSKVMAAGGLLIAVGLGEAVKQASDFQQKMELLVTAGGESQTALGSVSKGIEDIAIKTGTSLDQLADGMYLVEKAGYRGADGLNVLKAAAEGARAEGTDLSTMTQGLTSIMQSYASTMKDPVQATNELVAASGLAKTTMQSFVGSLPTVLPIASAAGIAFSDVAGALATLTQHGTSADEAAQELAASIRALQAPNSVAIKAMQQLGINVNDLESGLGKRGLSGSIELVVDAIKSKLGPAGFVVVDAFKKSQSAGEDMQTMLAKMPAGLKTLATGFMNGSISAKDYRTGIKDLGGAGYAMGTQFMALQTQAQGFNDLLKAGNPQAATFAAYLKQVMGGAIGMNTALQLTGDSTAYLNSAIQTVNKSAKESGKDISTWAQTQKNAATQMSRLKASGQVLAVQLGTVLLPTVIKIAKALGGMLAWFAGLGSGWQKMIVGVLGVVAALLLLASTFKKLEEAAKALKALALLLKLNVLWTNLVAAATKAWAVVQGVLDAEMWASPIGLIILAIIAIVAAVILVIKFHKQIGAFFVYIWGKIWSFMKMIGRWFAGPFVDFFKKVWEGIQKPFLAIWSFLKGIGEWFAGPFSRFFIDGWNAVVVAFDFVKKYVMMFVNAVVAYFQFLWSIVSKILNFFAPLFKAVFGLIAAIVGLVMKLIWSFISLYLMLAWTAISAILGWITAAWNATWNFVKGVALAVWDWIYNKIATAVAAISSALSTFFGWITAAWNAAWAFVKGLIMAFWDWAYPYIKGAIDFISSMLSKAWNFIKTQAENAWNAVFAFLKGVWAKISSALSAIGGVGAKIGGYFQSAYDAVKGKIGDLLSYLGGLGGMILKKIGNFGSLLYDAGKKIIQGLIDGITSMIKKLTDKLHSITNMIPSWKGPIKVDAKLLSPNGAKIMKGLIDGIVSATPALRKTLQRITGSIPLTVAAHANAAGYNSVIQHQVSMSAAAKSTGGTYQLTLGEKVLAEFVIDTVTGEPKMVANTNTEGARQVGWAGSGRAK